MKPSLTGAQIRKSFIDFFLQRGHTNVASSSLVPGGDQTLLFTNAGMVQFKDVFLGTDHRPYSRAVNSQKCMRVAGKHNDLDDVGRDDTHHTFFEMLGNWSFGDYYKKEAIAWAWELLTEVWGLDKSRLWTTYFLDEKGEIPTDEEAATNWRLQPGIDPAHVLPFGRKENFWEMAEIGPCGPCSEIHIDRGVEYCDRSNEPGHVCRVNGDCKRFTELWNLVFIQYNRLSPTQLEPLPACHVDTGMGLERIVSVLQGVRSNYATDLLSPVMDRIQTLTGDTPELRQAHLTPYRVLTDHSRAAAFLIADGVVPGNTGRGYICRMIIRRAARFGSKLGLNDPFLAKLAEVVIENYGDAYPELVRNRKAILDNLTREEIRFRRTVEGGISQLDELLKQLVEEGSTILDGELAFDLYATHGLPLEITRDIAREQGLDVDEDDFRKAMEEHRLISGSGKAFGTMGGDDVDVFRSVFEELVAGGKLPERGVEYLPYLDDGGDGRLDGEVLAIIHEGISIDEANEGDLIDVILPKTIFYVESGGQVSDTGVIQSNSGWTIQVQEMRKPAAGIIVHRGVVVQGNPKVGDSAQAIVDIERRLDIMRNHTATHLLHAELRRVLGEHARQAGSLVAPDRLRFDFSHPEAVTPEQLEEIEAGVNRVILENRKLRIAIKPLAQAINEGAMALFGEKYAEDVRTITIGDTEELLSYELCGGTHVDETGIIGLFLIVSEGSAAAGIRRIEAVTGRAAYQQIQKRWKVLKVVAGTLNCGIDEIPEKIESTLNQLEQVRKQAHKLRLDQAVMEFDRRLQDVPLINGVPVLTAQLFNADPDTLRLMADRFREKYQSGVVVLGTVYQDRPLVIAAVTEDLIKRGVHAGDLVRFIAPAMGGSGGGRPNLAQAGGKEPSHLEDALGLVTQYCIQKIQ
ncbi:MAG TPA: alanine--tRNA ligase [Anaerolineaceae bacterium]|nr:alanine--tRNA ligase [Anaerolineaceae bacterium]